VGTFDTKAQELRFIEDRLRELGISAVSPKSLCPPPHPVGSGAMSAPSTS